MNNPNKSSSIYQDLLSGFTKAIDFAGSKKFPFMSAILGDVCMRFLFITRNSVLRCYTA